MLFYFIFLICLLDKRRDICFIQCKIIIIQIQTFCPSDCIPECISYIILGKCDQRYFIDLLFLQCFMAYTTMSFPIPCLRYASSTPDMIQNSLFFHHVRTGYFQPLFHLQRQPHWSSDFSSGNALHLPLNHQYCGFRIPLIFFHSAYTPS